MSIRGYAAARHVDRKSVRRGIARHEIVLDAEGRIDPVQADRDWYALRPGPRHDHDGNPAAAQAARGKIAELFALLKRESAAFEKRAKRYVNRQHLLAQALLEARHFPVAMRAAADSPAVLVFAERAGLDPASARAVVQDAIELALHDIGDLEDQARRAVEAA